MALSDNRKSIGLVNTGSSNLQAVLRILEKEGFRGQLVELGEGLPEQFDCLVLPGVGHFGFAMEKIEKSGADFWLREVSASGTPILGICLGGQLLFGSSEEAPGVRGLGLIPGEVLRLPRSPKYKSPHMGWNSVSFDRHKESLGVGMEDKSFYFAHSFFFSPQDQETVIATTEHGFRFCTIAGGRGLLAMQFHPEKSGRTGHRIFKRSLEWLCQRD